MAFNGIEIDMLSLGDADCILVTHWKDDIPTYILIDGGYAKDILIVEKFLGERNVDEIDHLVSTHLHNDHIRGLVKPFRTVSSKSAVPGCICRNATSTWSR